MKKTLCFLIPFFVLFLVCLIKEKNYDCKVFDLISPTEIVIDFNRNLVRDEKTPYKLSGIYFVSPYEDYTNDSIFKNLTDEQKYCIYKAGYNHASKILKNKFVTLKNNDIFSEGKSYKKELLSTGFFYDNTEESKIKLLKRINSFCSIQSLDSKQQIKDVYSLNSIKIFFLELNSVFKPQAQCNTSACKALKQEIDNAKNSIDFAIYGFHSQPQIYTALKNAQERGVKIRWVYNHENSNDLYYPDIEKLKKLLPNFNSNIKKKNGIMHNKFFIFDNQKVFTGSANITSTDLTGFNANYSVLLDSKDAAKVYKKEFEQMYVSGRFSNRKNSHPEKLIILDSSIILKILFSPQDKIIDKNIIKLIDNSTKYIYVPVFFITHNEVLNSLINAKKRGVDVKVINDATNASSRYTIHKKLRQSGIKVKTENYAGKMHMKTLIIDDKYSVIGSMNITASGNLKNDENVLIIENKEIARYMKNTFIYLWNKIPSKYEKFDPKAESFDSIGSCFDGIDNDFDKKTDKKDEGCFIKN